MNELYICVEESGAYSDYQATIVGVFSDIDKAKAVCARRCRAEYDENDHEIEDYRKGHLLGEWEERTGVQLDPKSFPDPWREYKNGETYHVAFNGHDHQDLTSFESKRFTIRQIRIDEEIRVGLYDQHLI